MKSHRHRMLATVLLGAGCLAGSAQAAIVSGTYNFSASGFSNGFGALAGSFTVSFDNSADILNSTALTLNSLTPNRFGTIGFSYRKAFDLLTFGGKDDSAGVEGLAGLGYFGQTGLEDFYFYVDLASNSNGAPSPGDVAVTNLGIGALAPASSVTFTFTPAVVPPVSVPTPSALSLVGAALLGLGIVRRRRAVPVC